MGLIWGTIPAIAWGANSFRIVGYPAEIKIGLLRDYKSEASPPEPLCSEQLHGFSYNALQFTGESCKSSESV
jgi:hypothetical protein